MIWGEKRKKRKNLKIAARQPVPTPPVKVVEVKASEEGGWNIWKQQDSGYETGDRGQVSRTKLPKGVAWGIGAVAAVFVVGFIVSFIIGKYELARSVSAHAETLSAGIADLQNFDPQGAEAEFSSLGLGTNVTSTGAMGMLGALLKSGGAFASFGDISRELVLLPQEYEALQSDIFSAMPSSLAVSSSITQISPNGPPSKFSGDLTALQTTVDALDDDTSQISEGGLPFGGSVAALGGSGYAALKSQLHEARQFLDSFAPWVGTSTPHHVLILFQNPSELRPAGGFLGSYADVTIADGAITDVAVHDVADVDAGFTQNIVPPVPLQPEIKRFRPADANWFFDFPTSASQTIAFFEASSLYASTSVSSSTLIPNPSALIPPSSSTSFDGAIAVSPQVVSDLLSVTGPITISVSSTAGRAASTTFTSDDFLVQVQKLVQDGQAQSNLEQEATYPKQVLGDLADAVFSQLASSTAVEKQGLFSMALNWVTNKDAMAYFKDPEFENFLTTHGAAGDVYQAPANFNGDYLALVDANVNGGKSDLYVSSTVTWQSEINADGTIDDSVVIERTHNGDTSPYWWYQVANQDYMQLFVPDGSELTNESGGMAKKIMPKVNYVKLGYAIDSTVAAIQSSTQILFSYPAVTSHEESGKEVFATWDTTNVGKSTEVSFEYSHPAFEPPAAGVNYQFIFEKQAGTARSYSFEFDAPIGYQFAENNLPSYTYTSENPPGRLIITLTLEKI